MTVTTHTLNQSRGLAGWAASGANAVDNLRPLSRLPSYRHVGAARVRRTVPLRLRIALRSIHRIQFSQWPGQLARHHQHINIYGGFSDHHTKYSANSTISFCLFSRQ